MESLCGSPSFIGLSHNMASKLKSAKELIVFLGKSGIAFLEATMFTIIPKPRKNVAGEIVLITGAGSGLGRLLAIRFARLGSVLVLWDINKEGNEDTYRMAREAGATRVYAYTCDCSQREDIYRVAKQVDLASTCSLRVVNTVCGYTLGHPFLGLFALLSADLPTPIFL